MSNPIGNAIRTVASGTLNATDRLVGGTAGAVAGAVNGFLKGTSTGVSGTRSTTTTESLLQHAKAQSEMINAVTSKPHTEKGHGPRGGVLPTSMSGLGDVAMKQGDKGVDQAGHAMKGVLGQMSQVMAMNMEVQTQMSIGQMIKNAYEGVTKEIKNLGNVKNMAGG